MCGSRMLCDAKCALKKKHPSFSCVMSHSHSLWCDFAPFPLPRHVSSPLYLLPVVNNHSIPRTAGQPGRLTEQSALTVLEHGSFASWQRRAPTDWLEGLESFGSDWCLFPSHRCRYPREGWEGTESLCELESSISHGVSFSDASVDFRSEFSVTLRVQFQ